MPRDSRQELFLEVCIAGNRLFHRNRTTLESSNQRDRERKWREMRSIYARKLARDFYRGKRHKGRSQRKKEERQKAGLLLNKLFSSTGEKHNKGEKVRRSLGGSET